MVSLQWYGEEGDSMHLRIRLANPAGNITLFVLDPVDPAARPALSAALMRRDPSVEQVAFVTAPKSGGAGRFEMMGGEFCGNACRAFGFLLARERFSGGVHTLAVEASGAASPVTVTADLDAGHSSAAMPLPRAVSPCFVGGLRGTLAEFEGINHLVLPHGYNEELLRAGQALLAQTGAEAWGVLFLEGLSMIPVVTVRSTGTTVFEGSCGSGSVAAACALGLAAGEGEHCCALRQPRGTILAAVTVREGSLSAASIGGSVSFGEPDVLTLPDKGEG